MQGLPLNSMALILPQPIDATIYPWKCVPRLRSCFSLCRLCSRRGHLDIIFLQIIRHFVFGTFSSKGINEMRAVMACGGSAVPPFKPHKAPAATASIFSNHLPSIGRRKLCCDVVSHLPLPSSAPR